MADRFGPRPAEVDRLLEAATLRLLGKQLGVERILIQDHTARLSFQSGVIPRMAVLEGPLKQGQVEVEVRRVAPLSLVLTQVGIAPLGDTLRVALEALRSAQSAAA